MDIILSATNVYFNAACAFIAVMCVVGFLLVRTDKKRWNAQKARSDEMMQRYLKKKPEEEKEEVDEKGKKKKKKKKEIQISMGDDEEPFEYESRINDKAFFVVAILLGAIGVLLGMVVYRHKWYKFNFRVYIPLLAVINIIMAAVVLYLLYMRGDSSASYVNW